MNFSYNNSITIIYILLKKYLFFKFIYNYKTIFIFNKLELNLIILYKLNLQCCYKIKTKKIYFLKKIIETYFLLFIFKNNFPNTFIFILLGFLPNRM